MTEPCRKLPMPVFASAAEVLRRTSECLDRAVDCCLATVVSRNGSAPSTPGQKLLVGADGTAAGTVGGGAVEKAIVERMLQVLASGQGEPEIVSFNLHKDLGMSCGGGVDLLVEPMWASTPLLLVGAGHVNYALARLMLRLGFHVVLVDERQSAIDPDRIRSLEGAQARLGRPDQVAMDVPRRGAVVVATHDHAGDVAAVVWAVLQGFQYVGGVGSRAKAIRVKDMLLAQEVPLARVDSVRMPVGMSIGARTPEEIAVSIAGELIAWRAGLTDRPQAPVSPASSTKNPE